MLEVVACHVLLMWICSLPMAFSTSMLCKERDTLAWRSRNCSLMLLQSMCMEYMLLFCCAKSASWVTCKPIVCLLAFLPHACCLALLQYVTCILLCNATSYGLRTPYGKRAGSGSRPPFCPSCVVCSHYACCLLILKQYVCLQVL